MSARQGRSFVRPGALSFALAAALASTVLLVGGCAAPPGAAQRASIPAVWPAGLPRHGAVASVVFFPEKGTDCGPAALATVLATSGVHTSVKSLRAEVFLPARSGTLPYDMLGGARRAGRVAYVLPPSLEALFTQVADGRPVVVLQKLGPRSVDWHFAVVTGYDLDADTVTLASGTASALVLSVAQFDATWAPGGRWGFEVLAPGDIPRQAAQDAYLAAVAPMETVAPAAARTAYEAALRRWPDAWVAMMGLGNLAYARTDWPHAVEHFEQAAAIRPDDADVLNNLALARLAAGDRVGARAAAQRAVGLGGPHAEIYRRTLDEVGKAR